MSPVNPTEDDCPTDLALLEASNEVFDGKLIQRKRPRNPQVPYVIPSWSEAPCYPYVILIIEDREVVDQIPVNGKGAYMFGSSDSCDFILPHHSASRFHAVIQFSSNGGASLYDVGSANGTFINGQQVKRKEYVQLFVGDMIQFGESTCCYIFQGPRELMAQVKRYTDIPCYEDVYSVILTLEDLNRVREKMLALDPVPSRRPVVCVLYFFGDWSKQCLEFDRRFIGLVNSSIVENGFKVIFGRVVVEKEMKREACFNLGIETFPTISVMKGSEKMRHFALQSQMRYPDGQIKNYLDDDDEVDYKRYGEELTDEIDRCLNL